MTNETTRLQARVEVLEDALRSAQASIATFIGVHRYPTDSGACDVLNEITAALAASIPADPVTNAGCCQAVKAERDDLRAKLEEAVAVLGWYSYQFCEGFCKDFPSDKYTDKNCEHDCGGCKARATLAAIKEG